MPYRPLALRCCNARAVKVAGAGRFCIIPLAHRWATDASLVPLQAASRLASNAAVVRPRLLAVGVLAHRSVGY